MKKFLFFLFAFILFSNVYAEVKYTTDEKVNRFYDRLMNLLSYDKYKEFYDEHINPQEISYDEFVKFIKDSSVTIAGSSESKLISWNKRGKYTKVTMELFYKGNVNKRERVFVNTIEKKDKIIIPIEEFKKIYKSRRVKR